MFLSFATTGAIQALNVVSGVLLARWLGPHDRGELAAILLWPALLAAFGGLGLADAATYHTARRSAAPGIILGTSAVIVLVQSLLLVPVGLGVVPLVLGSHDGNTVQLAMLYLAFIPITLVSTLCTLWVSGLQRFVLFSAFRLAVYVIPTALIFALAVLGSVTVSNVVAVYLISYSSLAVVQMAIGVWLARSTLSVRLSTARTLMKYALQSHTSNVSSMLNQRLDQLLISIFLAPALLGLYVTAVTMTSLTLLIGVSIAAVALPVISRLDNLPEKRQAIRRYLGIALGLSLLVTLPLLVLAPLLIETFFGQDYAEATTAARILLPAGIMLALGRVASAALRGLGRPLDAGIAELLGLAITLVALAFLLPVFDIGGAALASLAAYTASTLWAIDRVAFACGLSARELLTGRAPAIRIDPDVASAPPPASRPRFEVPWQAIGVVASIALLGLASGAVLSLLHSDRRDFLLAGIALVLLAPIAHQIATRRFDPLSAFTICSVALIVMFLVRPIALLLSDQMLYVGYDISFTFNEALALCFAGCLAFVLGYYLPVGRQLGASAGALAPRGWYVGTLVTYALGIFALGLFLYAMFILQSGGVAVLRSFLAGRLPEQNQLFVASTGYLYQGLLLCAPASMLLIAAGLAQKRRELVVLGVLFTVPLLTIAATMGGRLNLLILLASPVIFVYLHHGKRPGLLSMLALVVLVLPVGLGLLRDARVAEQRDLQRSEVIKQAIMRPDLQWSQLILGLDTGMFDTLATELTVVPDVLPYDHGATLRDPLIRSVPRPFWPTKPAESNDQLIDTLWPEHFQLSRSASASSLIGSLYQDTGVWTVAAGMALLGVCVRFLDAWRTRWPASTAVQIVFALMVPLLLLLLRGNLSHMLSIGLFTLVPLLFGIFLVRQGTAPRRESSTQKLEGSALWPQTR